LPHASPQAETARRGDTPRPSAHELRESREWALSFDSDDSRDQSAGIESPVDVLARVTRAQAIVAALVALFAAQLALGGQASALWALTLASLAGGGAALAELLLQRRDGVLRAGIALLGSQLGILTWAFALGGARAALLAFAPALAILALRGAGRALAIVAAAASLALYLADAILQEQGILQPALLAPGATSSLLDAGLVTAGLLLTLIGLLDLHAYWIRAQELAERRRREAEEARRGAALPQARGLHLFEERVKERFGRGAIEHTFAHDEVSYRGQTNGFD
jgi:hypothetical protein